MRPVALAAVHQTLTVLALLLMLMVSLLVSEVLFLLLPNSEKLKPVLLLPRLLQRTNAAMAACLATRTPSPTLALW